MKSWILVSEVNLDINNCFNISNLLHFLSCLARKQNLVNWFSEMASPRNVMSVEPSLYFFNDLFDNLRIRPLKKSVQY